MSDMPLPKTWPIESSPDGQWRHVNHDLRLASAGWASRGAAERNADLYRINDDTLRLMSERYEQLHPAEAPRPM